MNSKFAFCLGLLSLAAVARADTARSGPPCCSGNGASESTPAAAFSANSIYQLDSHWTDDAGRPVQLAELRGHPVVLAMFFTSCAYACPVIVHDMQAIRGALPAGARGMTRFVLVSFDTERDTPAVLKAYRTRMQLGQDGWTLLHGDPAGVQNLAMVLGVKYKRDAQGQFAHSNLITVLNPEGEIAFQRSGLDGDLAEVTQAVIRAAGHEIR